jgi:hypothetical protein
MCMNNLKQIAFALHNYHDEYDSFPPAYVADQDGKPMHSWRVLILPFMDRADLYNQYRMQESWDSPHNSKLAEQIPRAYQCPTFDKYHDHPELASPKEYMTNYAAIVHPNGIFQGTTPSRLDDVVDGTSNTVLVFEVSLHSVHWMEPKDVSLSQLELDLKWEATHTSGLHAAIADGSVRFIDSQLDHKTSRQLIRRNDGETLGPF